MRDDLQRLPKSLFYARTIREQEPQRAQQLGIDLYQVMQAAGRESWQCFKNHWPAATSILVICGRGNNGGDAFVVARLALESGMKVTLKQSQPQRDLAGDAATAKSEFMAAGGTVTDLQSDWPLCDVIVDGLLGSGITGELSDAMRKTIDRINQSPASVFSLDVPSGINGDTAAAQPIAVKAQVTITFVGAKASLLTGSGAQHAGLIRFAGLQLNLCGTDMLPAVSPDCAKVALSDFQRQLAPRSLASHKGQHGRVVIIGGDASMSGAVRIAGEGALRSGAGLTSVFAHPNSVLAIQSGRPELMVHAIETRDLPSSLDQRLTQRIETADAVAVGPGLGTSTWSNHVFDFVLSGATEQGKTMLIDADGLNLLSKVETRYERWILTPHPGEAAGLLQCDTQTIESDRFSAVQEIQRRYGGVVVLKGRGTLICDGEKTFVAPVGNPGLATGGSGDLLSGIIASLVAQGLTPCDAACCGVCIHGEAADIAAVQGQRGMLASDLMNPIRQLVNPQQSNSV